MARFVLNALRRAWLTARLYINGGARAALLGQLDARHAPVIKVLF